jgi:Actinobacteria/chloroflexi VLRF1 release factor
VKNVAGSGAKWVDVSGDRFPGWIASFAVRHGVPASARPDGAPENSLIVTCDTHYVTLTAPDGAVAECHPPFPESFAWPAPGVAPAAITTAVAVHAAAPRSVGVLLVRLGGYAAGVFTGYPPTLADAKVGSRPVHGRSAAGGWSQHRFARRREKQAGEALDAAADAAVLVFTRWESGTVRGAARGPAAGGSAAGGPARGPAARGGGARGGGGGSASPGRGRRLDAVVLGGDKRAVAELRDDPRLAPYLAIATERFLTVPDPRRSVLEAAPKGFLAVKIRLTEPTEPTQPPEP